MTVISARKKAAAKLALAIAIWGEAMGAVECAIEGDERFDRHCLRESHSSLRLTGALNFEHRRQARNVPKYARMLYSYSPCLTVDMTSSTSIWTS